MATAASRRGRHWWRDLRRAMGWHRRLLAAGLAAATVAVAMHALQPAAPATVAVLAAARDLAAGAVLGERDVAVLELPPGAVPTGALGPADLADPAASVTGRTVAGPVRAGEPLTDVRLVGPGLVAALGAGLVAAPVRIADAGTAALVRAGDRIDLLGTPAGIDTAGEPTRTIAADVVVVTVPLGTDGDLVDGALLVVATTPVEAAALAGAAVTDRLSITLRG